jgi:hypothetical protein
MYSEHNVGRRQGFGKVGHVRSLVVLFLALAGFGYLAIQPHRHAESLLRAEERALEELRARAKQPIHDGVAEAAGYEFRWAEGSVLLARPSRAGVRWFATADGELIYEYDPTLFQSGPSGPATEPMVQYLLLKPGDSNLTSRPPGWKHLN